MSNLFSSLFVGASVGIGASATLAGYFLYGRPRIKPALEAFVRPLLLGILMIATLELVEYLRSLFTIEGHTNNVLAIGTTILTVSIFAIVFKSKLDP